MPRKLSENIIQTFQNDDHQLQVLETKDKRIMVEAPPGYGKTKVLIGKTIKDLIGKNPPNHEKVLMLTFSVNSASKMRGDLNAELKDYPIELQLQMRKKTYITNFHGFARSVLSKYGHLLNPNLRDIKNYEVLAEHQLSNIQKLELLKNYANAIKEVNIENMNRNIKDYNAVIINELLPKKKLTHNSILTLTIQLLMDNKKLLNFYNKLYTKIVIDEFQDTNYLNIKLIELFLNDNLYIELFGDPLQRIYGFIGTVENIFDIFGEEHGFENYKLQTNYRFKNNENMLMLEKQIRGFTNMRLNSENHLKPLYNKNIIIYDNHSKEVDGVIQKIKWIQKKDPDKKIAILTPQRGPDIDTVIFELEQNKISCFNALELDVESKGYTDFCLRCMSTFQTYFVKDRRLTKKELNVWYSNVKQENSNYDPQTKELFTVLKAFLMNVVTENNYRRMNEAEKREYILNVFINKELHNYLSVMNEGVQVLTIHTAKGLEWDKVFLIDVEKDKLPNYNAMCKSCEYKVNCQIELDYDNEKVFLEQLSLFYVAVTRAREEVYISASLKNARSQQTRISCIFNLLNIKPLII